MSKASLKKELARMTHEQISELVLDLYAARPEAKEYLDFFVAPDIDRKLDKARQAISKEFNRKTKRYPRPRITKVRRTIKDIASLNPGSEPVADIMTFAIEVACKTGSDNWLKEVTQKNVSKLLRETITLTDRSGLLDIYLPRIKKAIEAIKTTHFYNAGFKNMLRDEYDSAIESLTT